MTAMYYTFINEDLDNYHPHAEDLQELCDNHRSASEAPLQLREQLVLLPEDTVEYWIFTVCNIVRLASDCAVVFLRSGDNSEPYSGDQIVIGLDTLHQLAQAQLASA